MATPCRLIARRTVYARQVNCTWKIEAMAGTSRSAISGQVGRAIGPAALATMIGEELSASSECRSQSIPSARRVGMRDDNAL